MLEGFGAVTLIAFFLAMALGAPLFSIAAVNTLFGLNIPLTFWTWLSAFWLNWLVVGGLRK